MALAPERIGGGRAARMSVLCSFCPVFDPISVGPERITATRDPMSPTKSPRSAIRSNSCTAK